MMVIVEIHVGLIWNNEERLWVFRQFKDVLAVVLCLGLTPDNRDQGTGRNEVIMLERAVVGHHVPTPRKRQIRRWWMQHRTRLGIRAGSLLSQRVALERRVLLLHRFLYVAFHDGRSCPALCVRPSCANWFQLALATCQHEEQCKSAHAGRGALGRSQGTCNKLQKTFSRHFQPAAGLEAGLGWDGRKKGKAGRSTGARKGGKGHKIVPLPGAKFRICFA
jgi:hypothetical protein